MGLMKKLTSVVVTAGLLLGLVGTAFAAYPADSAASAKRMQDLGIVQGDAGGLRLGDSITRAELIKVIVWAFGKGNDAKFLKGAPAFPDTANHWASGEIALAKNMIEANGFKLGLPDGTFNPQANVTAAEAVAMVMKFMGAPADASQAWPNDYLNGAVAAGILSADDKATVAGVANAPATRGLVFYLADTAFSTYKLSSGKTVYTQYVRPTAPTLTIDEIAPTTDSSVTVTGSVSSAYTDPFVVTVGSSTNVATVSGGKFTATVSDIAMGDNNISVMVTDEAGNVVTKTVKVTRTAGAAATIDAPATLTVDAGATADLAVAVKDAKGNVVADAAPTVTSDLGTFADGKFTAGQKSGTGTISIALGDLTASVNVTVNAGAVAKLVLNPATVDLTAGGSQKFTVAGQDQFGNTVAVSGATWSASKGIIGQDGSFGATNDATGTVTVTATAGAVSGTATVTVFGTATKLSASAPSNLVANGESTGDLVITALDANGNVAKNWNGTVTVGNTTPSIISSLSASAVALVNGTGTVTLTANETSGTGAITLNATGLTGYVVPVTVADQVATSVKVTLDPVTLAADNASRGYLNAELIDQTGNPITTSTTAYSVDFVISDTNVVSGSLLTGAGLAKYNGEVQLNPAAQPYVTSKNALGSATITATVKKNGVVSSLTANSVSVSTALVGVPYKLAIDATSDAKTYVSSGTGNQQKVVVRVLDVNGNQVTGDTGAGASSITLTTSGQASGATNQVLDKDGVLLAATSGGQSASGGKVTFKVTTNKIATVTYTATGTNGSNTLTQATATGNFVAGDAADVTLSASPTTIAATGNANTVLTAKIVDGAGNLVTAGSYSVKFMRKAGGNAVANWSDQTVTSSAGQAQVTITGTTNVADDDFQVSTTINGDAQDSGAYTRVSTRIIGVPNQLQFASYASSVYTLQNGSAYDYTAGTAGTAKKVYVAVVDAAGTNIVSYDNSTAVTLTVTDSSDAVTTYTATDVNGIATFSLTLNTADDYTLKATASGLKGANGQSAGGNYNATVTINAADATGLKLSSNTATLNADNSSYATVTVRLVDAYGNYTTTGANLTALTLSSNTQSVADVVAGQWHYYSYNALTGVYTDNGAVTTGSVKATAQVKSTLTTGSTTLTASQSGLTSSTTSLSTSVVGSPNRVSVAVDDTYAASTTASQKVTVTVLDALGNRVTNYNGYIDISTDSTTATVYDSIKALYSAAAVQLTGDNAGAYSFYVANRTAETVTYTAQLTDNLGVLTSNTSAGSTTGTFTADSMYKVGLKLSPKTVSSDTYATVDGDGSSVAVVTVQVQDYFGNLVSDATGTVKVQIANGLANAYIVGSDSAGVLTVDVVGGKAMFTAQTRDYAIGNVDLNVKYYTSGSATSKYDTTFTNAVRVLNAH